MMTTMCIASMDSVGAADAADAPRPASAPALEPACRARKVLLIEDLPLVQQLLRSLIEEPGVYEVCAISDTEAGALAAFDAHRPDAVIVDLNLREGSGLGFLQQLGRRDLPAPRPALIVVTNHAIPALEAACRKAGADSVLDKSRDLARLKSVLDSALSTRGDAAEPDLR